MLNLPKLWFIYTYEVLLRSFMLKDLFSIYHSWIAFFLHELILYVYLKLIFDFGLYTQQKSLACRPSRALGFQIALRASKLNPPIDKEQLMKLSQ